MARRRKPTLHAAGSPQVTLCYQHATPTNVAATPEEVNCSKCLKFLAALAPPELWWGANTLYRIVAGYKHPVGRIEYKPDEDAERGGWWEVFVWQNGEYTFMHVYDNEDAARAQLEAHA